MNILPKKRWHVRTKENIARVRKDEAEAAEKERQEKLRIDQADRELRLNILKQKSKEKLESLDILPVENFTQETDNAFNSHQHINLFSDIEHAVSTTNKEHDKEIKEKKEEYEKKIGYLTYLGQDTNEAHGKKNWYDVLPESSRFSRPTYIKETYDKFVLKDADGKPKKIDSDVKDGEIGWKSKQRHDPINVFRRQISKTEKSMLNSNPSTITSHSNKAPENKSSKHKKSSISDKELKLQKLREARLKREQQEKQKTVLFLTKLNGGQTTEQKEKTNKIVPKYNSQFNPELARQNYR